MTLIISMVVIIPLLLLVLGILMSAKKHWEKIMIEAAGGSYRRISARAAKETMTSESTSESVVIVDVRTPDEYAEGHIPGAVLIPVGTIGKNMPEALPDKEATILVYCRSGNRSRSAGHLLAAMGYKDIRDFGGIIDWPYEVER